MFQGIPGSSGQYQQDQGWDTSICCALFSPPTGSSPFLLLSSTASVLYPDLPNCLHETGYGSSTKGILAQGQNTGCTGSCPVTRCLPKVGATSLTQVPAAACILDWVPLPSLLQVLGLRWGNDPNSLCSLPSNTHLLLLPWSMAGCTRTTHGAGPVTH